VVLLEGLRTVVFDGGFIVVVSALDDAGFVRLPVVVDVKRVVGLLGSGGCTLGCRERVVLVGREAMSL
jgi:hypothetical protein